MDSRQSSPSQLGNAPGAHVDVHLGSPSTVKRDTAVKVVEAAKNITGADRANLEALLKELDKDQDGTINAAELISHLEKVATHRRERRWMWWIIAMLAMFCLCTIGAVVGLTYATMYALKDTTVSGSTMYVKGSSTDVVRTGSAEFTVVEGVMVARSSINPASSSSNASAVTTNTSTNGIINANPQAVMRTASYMGTPTAFSSRVPVRDLMELRYLYIKGTGEVELAVSVLGVARVYSNTSVHGTIVRILTVAGTITLDDVVISFSTEVADIFTEAGFQVSNNRRMLIGIYDVLGFFNFIRDLTVFNLPSTETKPGLPSADFFMKIKIFEPCAAPANVTYDRCKYFKPSELLGAVNDNSTVAVPHSSHRRVLSALTDAYKSTRSLLGSEPEFIYLPGTVVVNGESFMTHTVSTTAWQNLTRSVYEFALAPAFRKIELMHPTGYVAIWQEEVLSSAANKSVSTTYCSNFTIATEDLSATLGVRKGNSNSTRFEYLGTDHKLGRAARRFLLTVDQPASVAGGAPTKLEVSYWDTIKDRSPLAFEFTHSQMGHYVIEVLEYRNLTAADTADIAPAKFQEPARSDGACLANPAVPRVSDPFTVPAISSLVPDPSVSSNGPTINATRRAVLLDESAILAKSWTELDHVNGTGEWPEWAFQVYVGHQLETSQDPARRGRALQQWWNPTTWFSPAPAPAPNPVTAILKNCDLSGALPMPFFDEFPACKGIVKIQAAQGGNIYTSITSGSSLVPKLDIGLQCNYDLTPMGVPFCYISGDITGNTCSGKVKGCLGFNFGVKAYVAKAPGLPSIAKTMVDKGSTEIRLGEVCVGYDPPVNEFFINGWATVLWTPIAKIDASTGFRIPAQAPFTFKFDGVTASLLIGAPIPFIGNVYTKLGGLTFFGNTVLYRARTRRAAMAALSNMGLQLALEGNWISVEVVKEVAGQEWQGWSMCENLELDGVTTAGIPVRGYQLQLTGKGSASRVSGLALSCINRQAVEPMRGDPEELWQQYAQCPPGAYITAARVRSDEQAGPDADAEAHATSSVQFQCSDGKVLTSTAGYSGSWGAWTACPQGSYVCGTQHQAPYRGFNVPSVLSGLRLACCAFTAAA